MNFGRALLVVACAASLAACSFENKNEREADRITRAVINDDLRPVQGDIAKGVTIPRIKVAEWSDELSAQGKLQSIKEVTEGCDPGWHCFNVKFDKHMYVEHLQFDENGKVLKWNFHMLAAQPAS